jgi:Ca-activated chloride channel family protein
MKPLLFGMVCLGLLGSASLQTQPRPGQVITVRTDLVTLAVSVVDSRGRLVPGLTERAFTVYDGAEPRDIAFFSSEDIPATIGLVVDSSTSMRARRDDVTAGVAAFARVSHPGDEFFTVNFNEGVWPGLPPGIPFTQDPEQLRAALSAAPARGMTAVYDAVDRALDYLEHGSRDRKALIVISDGGDNASVRTLDSVLDHARRTSAIAFGVIVANVDDHGARPSVLKRLAAETGGRAFTPQRVADITTAFQDIAREIRSGYTIGFVPDEGAAGFRPIRVTARDAAGRPLIARTRAGYYAGPGNGGDQ